MTPDHVERLRIHVRSSDPHDGDLASAARRFTEAVLAQAAAHLNRENPEHLVFVRHLNLAWQLTGRSLARPETVDSFARRITDRLASLPQVSLPVTGADLARDVVVFGDEAHWRAAHAIARASSRYGDAWFFKSLAADGDPVAALCLPGRQDLAWRVLERLAHAGRLADVLAATDGDTVEALAAELLPAPFEAESASEDPSLVAELMAIAGNLPADATPGMLSLVFFVHARMAGHVSQSTVTASVAKVLSKLGHAHIRAAGSRKPDPSPAATPPLMRETPPDPADPGHAASAAPGEVLSQTEIQPAPRPAETVATRAAGLFYLLNPALELNVGEILWKACLPEAQVLAHAVAVLLGEALQDDPAVALFAGEAPGLPFPAVSADQQAEVSEALLNSLVTCLPRRSLARYPNIRMRLTGSGDRRLLVVHALTSPFILFARPADTEAAVRTAVSEFVRRWPRSAPAPRASGGLAVLDPGARTIPDDAPEDFPGTWPDADASLSTAMHALLLQIIGVMGHLFETRVSEEFSPGLAEFTGAYLALPGKVALADEMMTVFLGEDQVNIALRHGGMDRDPGWVAWIKRSVGFVFSS